MTAARGLYSFGRTSPTVPVAVLSYWYGLTGACATILLELYQHPKGRRVAELMDALASKAEPHIVKVYVCYLRRALRQTFDDADVVEVNWSTTGRYASCAETRYRLTPEAIADVRECLEMAHEQLGAILAAKAVRVAA